jgi:CRP-like cAMP-binding protein
VVSLGEIARHADELTVTAGEVLTREGTQGREAFLIVSGSVTTRRKGRKLGTSAT